MTVAQSKKHPNFWVRMVLDSASEQGIRLPTVHIHMPRMILAEGNTHRAFTRNAGSTRAKPTTKLIAEVRDNPYIPIAWLKNKPGMQASEPMSPKEAINAEAEWLLAADDAAGNAERLFALGLHKQWAGRVLEPFMWVDWLVSATDWANFFALRDDVAAQPEMQLVAQLVREVMDRSTPKTLRPGQWHLPYIEPEDYPLIGRFIHNRDGGDVDRDQMLEAAKKISAARCARISYAAFDGDGSIETELKRFDDLIVSRPVHASPVEHQASPDTAIIDTKGSDRVWRRPDLHGNFTGWVQHRKLIPFECVNDVHMEMAA